jgi:hypothetical protein
MYQTFEVDFHIIVNSSVVTFSYPSVPFTIHHRAVQTTHYSLRYLCLKDFQCVRPIINNVHKLLSITTFNIFSFVVSIQSFQVLKDPTFSEIMLLCVKKMSFLCFKTSFQILKILFSEKSLIFHRICYNLI